MVFVVGVVVAILNWAVIDSFFHRKEYRGQILTLYERLQPGMTKQEARQVMDSGDYPDLQFHRPDEGRWSGAAPLEFGAGNWILLVEFSGEHKALIPG